MKISKNNMIPSISLGIALTVGTAIRVDAVTFPAFTTIGAPDTSTEVENLNIATRFQVTGAKPIKVTALGAYLGGSDGPGLAADRTITLWDDFGNLLASEIIAQSTTGTEFAYVPLASSVTLNPGDTFRIAGFIDDVDGDNAVFSDLDFAAGITPINDSNVAGPNTYVAFDAPDFPDTFIAPAFQVSANFLFEEEGNPPSTVPEPGLIGGLILFGIGGLLQKRRDEN